jgi:lysophospholipase L1-like esterase
MKRGTKATIVWAVAALAVVAGAMGLRALFPPSKDVARLQRILDLLEMDPELLWRQRPGLDTLFEGTRVVTDGIGMRVAPPGAGAAGAAAGRGDPAIVALGASPTFGYGVEAEEAYPAVAERLLRGGFPGARVINAGQIGYSTWQGVRMFERHLERWSPSAVTVAYVVNDVERIRFFFPNGLDDPDTLPPTAEQTWFFNQFSRFPPIAALLRLRGDVQARVRDPAAARDAYSRTHVRVPPAEFESNLRLFVAMARERGIPIVFVRIPFRLADPDPPEVPGLRERVKALGPRIASGDLDAAEAAVDDALRQDPVLSAAHYLKGEILEARGDEEGAREAYARAVKAVIHDCARDARRYEAIMEQVARDSGVPLADAADALAPGGVADMRFFVPGDYIHPNAAGHAIVGRCVAAVLERALSGETGFLVQKCE